MRKPAGGFGHQMTRVMNELRQFEKHTEVVLRADARGGQVHYTLDGSEPTTSSPAYTQPLALRETTTVTANTFDENGHAVGFPDQAVFTKVAKVQHQSWLASTIAGRFVGPKTKDTPKRNTRPKQWAGMSLVSISEFPDHIDATGGQAFGAFVVEIDGGSAAAAAGIEAGDTVIRLGSTEVRDLKDLNRAIKSVKDQVKVTVFRGYENIEYVFKP